VPNRSPTPESLTINEWADLFHRLYRRVDEHRRPEEFWLVTSSLLSEVGEAIRTTQYGDIVAAAGHAFAWMCAYVTHCRQSSDVLFRFNATLPETVALKYPIICGHCGGNPCRCDPVAIEAKRDKAARYTELRAFGRQIGVDWNKYSLGNWLEVFWGIYGTRTQLQSLETIGYHLIEEAGEESRAVRMLVDLRSVLGHGIEGVDEHLLNVLATPDGLVNEYEASAKDLDKRYSADPETDVFAKLVLHSAHPVDIRARIIKSKMDAVVEFADTFSWLCSVLNKVRRICKDNEIFERFHDYDLLDVQLRDFYNYNQDDHSITCYKCGHTSCICRFFPIIGSSA
jgi:hypothetical protein